MKTFSIILLPNYKTGFADGETPPLHRHRQIQNPRLPHGRAACRRSLVGRHLRTNPLKTFIVRYQLVGKVLDLENQVQARTIQHAAQRLGIAIAQIIDYQTV